MRERRAVVFCGVWLKEKKKSNRSCLLSSLEFRDTIGQKVRKDLHLDSEAEIFAAYILTGINLFTVTLG